MPKASRTTATRTIQRTRRGSTSESTSTRPTRHSEEGQTGAFAQLQRTVGNKAVGELVARDLAASAGQAVNIQRNGSVADLVKKYQGAKTAPPAAKKTLAERMQDMKGKGSTLKMMLSAAFTEYTPTLADLKPYIDAAPQDQRDAAWGDTKLMGAAHTKLSKDDYLALLPALRMFKPGKTAEDNKSHTAADKADKLIRDKLSAYVGEAVKAGRQVSGQVAVVDGKDWEEAYDREFGNDGEEDTTNAFVDRKGIIWIHKNRGNAGTAIHEGVHKYAKDDFLSTVGFNFNEGVTEYFTRKICSSLPDPISRGNYEENYVFAKSFTDSMGEATVAKAYFDGAVADLKKVVTDKGLNWDTIVAKVKAKDWAAAVTALTPAPPPTHATPPTTAPTTSTPPTN